MKAAALLRETARRFSRARLHYGHGTHNAREEANWLFSHVLGSPIDSRKCISDEKQKKIETLVHQRIQERVPLAYLLNEAWLGEHAFYVDRRAIVPRSFIAELLQERLRPWLTREPGRVLDLGTGSGCLAVLLALTFENSRIDAADLSSSALEVAKINIRKYRLEKRIRALRSDLFESLKRSQYDLIVCNPPYVTARSIRKLPREYRREPALALSGGEDGLDLVRKILSRSGKHLAPGGLLVCEIGGNRRALERAYPELPFVWPEISAGPGCVFILGREQLPASPNARTASASRMSATQARARR